MKYKIVISNKANQLIKNHLLFLANVSKESARKLNKEFKSAIKKIAEDPKMYQLFECEFIPYGKYRKYVVSKRYLIIYHIKEDSIFVDYVIDTRSDYSWLVR
ncbi:MAG: type II toxin-antitoxin system RelE/ParE family toxin [Firmicutes bacterium]|nr:type II toxin-antitoxin system RelE/ParE family toxin [Candidatus Colivicinus equi]